MNGAKTDQHELFILGQRLAEARKAKGATQEEVAQILGCSRPTYIAIEKGKRKLKAKELIKLSSFLGVSLNVLLRASVPVEGIHSQLCVLAKKMGLLEKESC